MRRSLEGWGNIWPTTWRPVPSRPRDFGVGCWDAGQRSPGAKTKPCGLRKNPVGRTEARVRARNTNAIRMAGPHSQSSNEQRPVESLQAMEGRRASTASYAQVSAPVVRSPRRGWPRGGRTTFLLHVTTFPITPPPDVPIIHAVAVLGASSRTVRSALRPHDCARPASTVGFRREARSVSHRPAATRDTSLTPRSAARGR